MTRRCTGLSVAFVGKARWAAQLLRTSGMKFRFLDSTQPRALRILFGERVAEQSEPYRDRSRGNLGNSQGAADKLPRQIPLTSLQPSVARRAEHCDGLQAAQRPERTVGSSLITICGAIM